MIIRSKQSGLPALTIRALLLMAVCHSLADGQVTVPHTTYKLVPGVVYESRPVTRYRFEEQKVLEQKPVTTYKVETHTEMREERYRVAKPIVETSERIQRYKVMRPVTETTWREEKVDRTTYETETRWREERRTVERQVEETSEREERRTVLRPVTEDGISRRYVYRVSTHHGARKRDLSIAANSWMFPITLRDQRARDSAGCHERRTQTRKRDCQQPNAQDSTGFPSRRRDNGILDACSSPTLYRRKLSEQLSCLRR